MLIKARDDSAPALAALRDLLTRPDVDRRTRGQIEDEIRTLSAGSKAEGDAAYQIDFCFGGENVMVIHDLRLEHRGRVAQIDHVIMNRFMEFLICESKSFKEGVSINERGEWTSFRNRRAFGIPSPIAQNDRHIEVLKDVFEDGLVEVPTRLGRKINPEFKNVVLVSDRARISRPTSSAYAKAFDAVIKVDQLKEHYDRSIEERTPGQVISAVAFRVTSRETMTRIARRLAALHVPITFDWAARFGLAAAPTRPQDSAGTSVLKSVPPDVLPVSVGQAGPRCESCAIAVSAAAVSYCLANASRFGGQTLCYKCQRKVGRTREKAVSQQA